jgi:hypothetical protein
MTDVGSCPNQFCLMFYHNDPKIGQRIRLVGGQKGVIKDSVENLGFQCMKFNACSAEILELFLDIIFSAKNTLDNHLSTLTL